MERMTNTDLDLIGSVELSALLDERYSSVRHWITKDPKRLPRPLWIEGFPYWPFQQVMAFVTAGEPRNFPADPEDFVPAGLAAFGSERPAEPFKRLKNANV